MALKIECQQVYTPGPSAFNVDSKRQLQKPLFVLSNIYKKIIKKPLISENHPTQPCVSTVRGSDRICGR